MLLDDMKPLTRSPLVDPFGRDDLLSAHLGDGSLRFPLRLLHGRGHAVPARKELLTLEELDRIATAFVARGTRKLRLTGGEPLVRRDIMSLFRSLSRHLTSGALDELTLTTNGSLLHRYADELAGYGVRRINVSLDTLDADKFREITRRGDLNVVLAGIEAARKAGMRVKINAVALKGVNDDEIEELMLWSHGLGMDLTLIEVMPMGEIEAGRIDQYLPLSVVRGRLMASTRSSTIPTGPAGRRAMSAIR